MFKLVRIPFLIFIYYYVLTTFFATPIGYILPNIDKIYNYNKLIAIVLVPIMLIYAIWYTKYTLNKVFFGNYKRYEIVSSLKEINYCISSLFWTINFICQLGVIGTILSFYTSDNLFIPILIVNTIIEYLVLSIFFGKYIKINKKEIDPIDSDIF